MRILVIGCSGQLARCLLRAAEGLPVEVQAVGRPALDVTDHRSLSRAIDGHTPDLLVNAAAYTAVDKAESDADAAFAANAQGSEVCASVAAAAGLPVIQVSTDYVFDGTKAIPYIESDPTGPINVYGRSKLEGELLVRGANPRHLIVRTAWVISPYGTNFCKTMLRLAAERDQLRIVGDQRGSPTYALDLANGLLAIARQMVHAPKDDPRWGIYHLAGTGEATWADLASATLSASQGHGGRVVPVTPIPSSKYPTPARRPRNSRLDCGKAARVFGVRLPPWQDAVQRCVAEIMSQRA